MIFVYPELNLPTIPAAECNCSSDPIDLDMFLLETFPDPLCFTSSLQGFLKTSLRISFVTRLTIFRI